MAYQQDELHSYIWEKIIETVLAFQWGSDDAIVSSQETPDTPSDVQVIMDPMWQTH